ncbi:protein MLN51 homolog [Impatiens glandulifera]|uniref:protein MLN51 homolog n=1 Tax=Impatiens glandulifera TaxID=253017 RepID=UPI001FB15514|nr:protein MLN51 homolog [Impatiens glandulifera]
MDGGKNEHIAASRQDEVEYETDSEEEPNMSLAMRRKEASDDEEGGEMTGKSPTRIGSRVGIGEPDDEGAVEEYDYGESDEEEYEKEEEEGGYVERGRSNDQWEVVRDVVDVREERVVDKEVDGDGVSSVLEAQEIEGGNQLGVEEEEGEEKKETEPFAIPTTGAFYMHDDRFRDNVAGRNRKTLGGKQLWESKDAGKWGHDKFEEITLHERHYDNSKERRNGGGHYGAHKKYQAANSQYPRGNKSMSYNNTQTHVPKIVRGRGPRRYGNSIKRHNEAPPQYVEKSYERVSNASSGRLPNVESDSDPHRKQNFASSLNSASPPFYPSASSKKEIPLAQKRDMHAGSSNRGKSVSNSVGIEKPYIHESVSGKLSTASPSVYGSSSNKNANDLKPQGRGVASQRQMNFPQRISQNQMYRPTQDRGVPQSRVQTSLEVSARDLGRSLSGGSQNSSPTEASLPVDSFEHAEQDLPLESVKSNASLVGKGRGGIQASGKGFIYGGAHVIGTSGNMAGHGDKNFAATPAFLPVMPFGGQHSGSMGVPAVGMAFPGYVAQQQRGLGASEMTWLPVLAGAGGSMGGPYCSPYIAVDGAYHVRQSGPASSSPTSSIEENVDNSNAERKVSQTQEITGDEIGQRQKNSRRYTEMSMSFGQ